MLLLLEGAFFYSRMPGLARIFYVGVLEVLSAATKPYVCVRTYITFVFALSASRPLSYRKGLVPSS